MRNKDPIPAFKGQEGALRFQAKGYFSSSSIAKDKLGPRSQLLITLGEVSVRAVCSLPPCQRQSDRDQGPLSGALS